MLQWVSFFFFHSAEETFVEGNAVQLPDMEDSDPDEPEGEDVKRDEQLGILQILDKLDEVADILING
jgi:hypothetical protein